MAFRWTCLWTFVRQLCEGVPLAKEMILALNPKRSEWDEIKAGLDRIGYPNNL